MFVYYILMLLFLLDFYKILKNSAQLSQSDHQTKKSQHEEAVSTTTLEKIRLAKQRKIKQPFTISDTYFTS